MNEHHSWAIAELASNGIRALLKPNGQLLLPLRVWITWKEQWFISTWLPAAYSVPIDIDIVALCRECLGSDDGGGWYTIPERITAKYRLKRLDYEVVDDLLPISEDDDDDE